MGVTVTTCASQTEHRCSTEEPSVVKPYVAQYLWLVTVCCKLVCLFSVCASAVNTLSMCAEVVCTNVFWVVIDICVLLLMLNGGKKKRKKKKKCCSDFTHPPPPTSPTTDLSPPPSPPCSKNLSEDSLTVKKNGINNFALSWSRPFETSALFCTDRLLRFLW